MRQRGDRPRRDERDSMSSTYSQFQPDWVDADDCPCANHIDGHDDRCPQHGGAE
jgi:hypothetical protein